MAEIRNFMSFKTARFSLMLLGIALLPLPLLQADSWKKRVMLDSPANSQTDTHEETDTKESASPNSISENAKSKAQPEKSQAAAAKKPPVDNSSDAKDAMGEGEISLNFQDASLSNLINYMADIRKMNMIPSTDTADVKVSLNMRESVDKEKAWEIFTTLLDISGFCLVKTGNLYKVVKKEAKGSEPHPLYIGVPAEALPDSSKTIRFITFLKNTAAADAESFIKNFLDPKAQVISQPTLNALILTERSDNIKYAMSILNELDDSGIRETCQIIRLDKSVAADVKKFLDDLIKKPETSGLARLLGQQSEGSADFFPGNVKLISEDRTNSLIMLGTPNSLKKIESFITEYFEGNWRTRTPFFPYECQYTDCDQIKSVLDDIIASESSAAKAGSTKGGARYLGNVRIESDKYSNKLIIYSQDEKDLALVKDLVLDLDKPQPMVALEIMIVQVTQTEDKEFGGQVRNKVSGQPIPGVDFQSGGLGPILTNSSGDSATSILGNLIGQVQASGQGSTILTVGDGSKANVWAVFRAISSISNTNIIANTFTTVANRTKGSFSAGSEQRIVGEKGQGDGALAGFVPVSASTDLSFTPQISPDGLISLGMDLKISEFEGAVAGDTTQKKLTTTVTMSDGQILVLGGFIKTRIAEGKAKTPFFGDIPLIGWLAKGKTRNVTKSYIFIFVSPTIIKPRRSPGSDLYTKIKLHDATEICEQTSETWHTRDPIDNLFFNYREQSSSHKVVDFANARYQPTTVDLQRDTLYRGKDIVRNLTEESLTTLTHENISVGQDKVKLTIVDSEPLAAATIADTTDHTPLVEKKAQPPKPRATKKNNSELAPLIKKTAEERAYKKPVSAAKTQLATVTKKIAPEQKFSAKKPALETSPTNTVTVRTKIPNSEKTAQSKSVVFRPIEAVKEKIEPTESDPLEKDFDELMSHNKKNSSRIFGVNVQESEAEEESENEDKLDAIFKQESKKSKVLVVNTETEPELDDLFLSPSLKKKRAKNGLSEFEEDVLDPKIKRHSRLERFSKTLKLDSHGKADEEHKLDDFDLKMATKQHRGPFAVKLKHQHPRSRLLEDEDTADSKPNLEVVHSSRENKFKKLMLSKNDAQEHDLEESTDL